MTSQLNRNLKVGGASRLLFLGSFHRKPTSCEVSKK
jgi:hypothetical protein